MKYFCNIFVLLLSLNGFCGGLGYNYDYSQVWTTKMFLSKPDGKGGSNVSITFEQALDIIRKADYLTLGVPKIIYLVGWQYNGHDDKYPAFFEVNPALKRSCDESALESLRWLMKEAKKFNTVVSLHINMTDAYDDSHLWKEYVENDLISKSKNGNLKVIGEYNGRKAYQINYKNEWNKGYTQMRIDRLLQLLPELKDAGTIHIDAWIARSSEGHNESVIVEADYQKKALKYWKAKGIDVTSEWVMDYMTGYIPLAWHFNGFFQSDYLTIHADIYTGVGINPDIRDSDHDLGFLFGTSSYGEPFWKMDDEETWITTMTNDFMLKCPQYFYLNKLKRIAVDGNGKDRVARFDNNVKVSLADSTVSRSGRIMRHKNTISFPAVWRDDSGIILYTADEEGNITFDIPFEWGNVTNAAIYKITSSGLQFIKNIKIKGAKFDVNISKRTPYYVIPGSKKIMEY